MMRSVLMDIYYIHEQVSKNDPLRRRGCGSGILRVRGLAFVYDKVVVAESIEDLQRMLSKLNASMKNMGLKMKLNKTKIIVSERKGEKPICNIVLNDEGIEQIDKYVKFGSLFTNDGKINRF